MKLSETTIAYGLFIAGMLFLVFFFSIQAACHRGRLQVLEERLKYDKDKTFELQINGITYTATPNKEQK